MSHIARPHFSLVFFLLTFCLTAGLQAQSKGMSDEKRQSLVPLQTVVTYGDTGVVLVLLEDPIRPKALTLIRLDTLAGVALRKEIPLGNTELPEFYEEAFAWGDKLTLVTSVYYPGPQRNHLIVRQYSLPELEEVSSQFVDEVYMPYDLQIPFGHSISPSGDQLLLYGWSYTLPEDSARLSLTVLDRDLNKRSDREVKLPYTNETFKLYGAQLADDGGIYILAEDYTGNPRSWNFNESRLMPVLVYLPPNGQAGQEYVLRPDDRQVVSGLRICLDDAGKLHGLGFFQRRNRSQHDGLFSFSLDGPTRAFRSSPIPIDRDRFRGAGPNRNATFEGFVIDELWWENGSLIWAAEQTIADPTGSAELMFGDLLIGRVNDLNSLAWLDRIPRQQPGAWPASTMLSFKGLRQQDNFYFVYGGTPIDFPNRIPYNMAVYNASGREKLTDITRAVRSSTAGLPQPVLSYLVRDERLLMFGVRAKESRGSNAASNTRFQLQMLRAGEEYSPAQYEGYLILLPLE